jgi:uncharacterized protein (TIGR03435 family)
MTRYLQPFTIAALALSGALISIEIVAGQQSPPATPAASNSQIPEVTASIRRNTSGDTASPVRVTPGTFTATNYIVRGLITQAYELQTIELFDVPAWALQERYDIVAQFDNGDRGAVTNNVAMRQMLKQLLAERFNLKLHKEVRTIPVYALILDRPDGRLGRGLRVSSTTCQAGVPTAPGGRPCGLFGGPLSQMGGDAVTLPQIAKFLSSAVQRIVVERTGLAGTYDLDLSFTREVGPEVDPNSPPSIFTALKEQLGLQLKAENAPIEVTVVDRFDRPESR